MATTLRSVSDLKVGDWIRSNTNQATYEVTEVQAHAVYVKRVTGNIGGVIVVPERILHNYVIVDKKSGKLSPPVKRNDSVRLHYKIHAGVLAALDVMANRQNTPEERARAVAKGFIEPYMFSVRRLIRVKLDTAWSALTPKQAKMISDVVFKVEDALSAGRDKEVCEAYDVAIENASKQQSFPDAFSEPSKINTAPLHPARGTDTTLDADTAPRGTVTPAKPAKPAIPTARERRKPRFTFGS